MSGLGADGPARRSSLVSRASWTGPPPIHSPQTAAGRYRMTRSSRRSPPRGTACGFWIRAWGRREPAGQGTERLNSPAPGLGALKGGLDIPATHAGYRSLRIEHPNRTLTRRVCTRAKRTAIPVLAHMARSHLKRRRPWFISRVEQGPGHRAVPARTGRPLVDTANSCEHEWPGVVTASDQIKQPLYLPRRCADGPTPRVRHADLRNSDSA